MFQNLMREINVYAEGINGTTSQQIMATRPNYQE